MDDSGLAATATAGRRLSLVVSGDFPAAASGANRNESGEVGEARLLHNPWTLPLMRLSRAGKRKTGRGGNHKRLL